jgi:hypothetical protein
MYCVNSTVNFFIWLVDKKMGDFSQKPTKNKILWTDLCDDDYPYELPVMFHKVNEISKDLEKSFQEKLDENVEIKCSKATAEQIHNTLPKIKDFPEDLNTEYVDQQNYRKRDCTTTTNNSSPTTPSPKSETTPTPPGAPRKRRRRKCYLCFPRKRTRDAMIQLPESDCIYHFDLSNRNCILVSPKQHFTSFQDTSPTVVGELFKNVHHFCSFWNIKDYTVLYHQGSFQHDSHFTLKIKTNNQIIKKLKDDHYTMKRLQRDYRV